MALSIYPPAGNVENLADSPRRSFDRCRQAVAGLLLVLSALCTASAAEPLPPPLYALITGGGPDLDSNAAQIEGHVQFVAGMLPANARRVVLFTDGKADQATVTYADLSASADARHTLTILLGDNDAAELTLTRAPKLGVPLDGPARLPEFRRALAKLSAEATRQPAPLLLYFAGHGSQNEKNEQDSAYDLWNGDTLKVRALAAEIARLPRPAPVVLVMAQCFSGAFADVLFHDGNPKGALVEQNIAGFFSAKKDREAAGCSYATGQADYQDFSSYFFGALCGHDRFGGPVTGADYDGNGTVSLHEAFCYALIHDRSADTPVCTSDVFLQRFAPLPDAAIYGAPYPEIWQAGTPAQRAALDALSQQLDLSGDARALAVFDRLKYSDPIARPALIKAQDAEKAKLNVLRATALTGLFERWPALRWGDQATDYQPAFDGALAEVARDQELCHATLAAEQLHEQADENVEDDEAALQRFASVYGNIVAARHLRAHGKPEIKAQFERLWKAEQGTVPTAVAAH